MVLLLNPILSAGSIVFLYLLARKLFSRTTAVMLVFFYGLGTITWYYAKSAFSEPLITFLLLISVVSLLNGRNLITGVALAGMILTKQTAIFLVLPVLWLVWMRRGMEKGKITLKSVLCLIIPLLVGQLMVWAYNAYRFGNPIEYGYRGATWDTPFLLGLYSLLLSPGGGLFIYSPILIIGILGLVIFFKKGRREKEIAWFILTLTLAYLIPHALYSDWAGGGGWGTRLLIPLVPFMILPVGEIIERWQTTTFLQMLLTIFLTVSIFIQVLGVSTNWVRHLQRTLTNSENPVDFYNQIYYNWPTSPILGQFQSLDEVISILDQPESRQELWELIDQTEIAESGKISIIDWQSKAVDRLSFNLPDFWFIYWYFFGISIHLLISWVVVFLGIILWMSWTLRTILLPIKELSIGGVESL